MKSEDENAEARAKALKEAVEGIVSGRVKDEASLKTMKRTVCKKHCVTSMIRNSEILEGIPAGKRSELIVQLLKKRPMRTISGVSPIAIMCNVGCPHGKCAYCPRGENAAQSYTGREPAAMRAIQNNYDAFLQTKSRVEQLESIGHATEKCELIIMGGTFNAQPREKQEFFVKRALDAMNGKDAPDLETALKWNEKAKHRAVGITFETRPDWCKEENLDGFLEMGGTRIELGVQTLDDEVYKRVKRGHTVADVAQATRAAKDSAFKLVYHMMPGLLSNKEKDVRMFKQLFTDERFKPDMLKIYPFMVMPGTEMFEWWKKGEIAPYSTEEAAEVIAEASRHIPRWCRVMRMQRDIPVQLIAEGVKKSNLRQLAEEKMKAAGVECECIRCRELGLKMLKEGVKPDYSKVKLNRVDYAASGGKEIFLSFDEEKLDALVGFVRLRMPGGYHRLEIDDKTALIRELHVYGEALAVGKVTKEKAQQHRRYGEQLLAEAEKIASEEFDKRKMVIISGVGVKEYYRKLGYSDDGPYVSRKL